MGSERMATGVDEFLAALPDDQRAALERLRQVIRGAVPEAVELINYGVPAFRLHGRNLVSFGAGRDHCSFYVQSPEVMAAHAARLAGFKTSKGTVTFTPEHPIPDELVRSLVTARVAENEARHGAAGR
ncbi:MAG TPA: DUF1801 domain-containing protein [Candidatus Limnocylindria bacterium]